MFDCAQIKTVGNKPGNNDDLFASMTGEKFTKLDMANAYQQSLLLDAEVLTVNTHRGLFEPTRLVWGALSHQHFSKRN